MSTTIDAAGRLVIPKGVRQAAGLRAGMSLEVRYRDGRIEIQPLPVKVDIKLQGGVAVASAKLPKLTHEDIEEARARLRDERG